MENRSGNRKKRIFWLLIFVAVNILVIAWTAYREFGVNEQPVAFSLGENGGLWLAGGVLCIAIVIVTEMIKMMRSMRAMGGRLSVYRAFETVALGKYYDAITPTGGGGQPFQMYWLHHIGYPVRASSVVPASCFITRQLAAILAALAVFVLSRDAVDDAIRYTAYAGLVCCAIPPFFEIAISLRPRATKGFLSWMLRLGEKLRLVKDHNAAYEKVVGSLMQYHGGFAELSGERTLLFELMFYSVLCRIALCSIPFFVLRSLGCPAEYPAILVRTIYIYAAVTLIPTPGNSGVSEGAFYYVFSEIGASGIFWAMLIWRLICYYSFLLIGLVILGKQTRDFISAEVGTKEDQSERIEKTERRRETDA